MTMKSAADDVLTFLMRPESQLSRSTERALVVRIGSMHAPAANEAERRHCENAAIAALTLMSTAVRVAAIRVLAVHGAPASLPMLRCLAGERTLDAEIRAASTAAITAIAERAGGAGSVSVPRAEPGFLSLVRADPRLS